MPLGTTFAWIFFIAVLGVTMAIPMKRQMINIEQIRFPDSIATAETLKVLYSEGKRRRARPKLFFILPFFAAANAIAMAAGGERWLGTVQQHILGNWYQRTIFFKWDLMFVGAGALVGMKTSSVSSSEEPFAGLFTFRGWKARNCFPREQVIGRA